MRGKKARALRRLAGFNCSKNAPKREYAKVVAAVQQILVLDEDATKAAGEPRVRLGTQDKITLFHNDAARAVYRHSKKNSKRGE